MKLLATLSLSLFWISLSSCTDVSPTNESASNQNSDDEFMDEDEDYDDPYADWFEIHEPFGDESYLYYKLTPAKPVPGQPVEIQVHAGSAYGPNGDVQIMARATAGSEKSEYGMIADPKAGAEWTKLRQEGIYVSVWNEETDEDKELRFEPGDQGYKQYGIDNSGHANYVGSINVTAETPQIELRMYVPKWENDQLMKGYADNAVDITPSGRVSSRHSARS